MRGIERGLEPPEVAAYPSKHTQDWVDYYCDRVDNDSPIHDLPRRRWVPYIELLGSRSNYNCWYCERRCKISKKKDNGREIVIVTGDWSASVDHFRPRSLFPHLSLAWDNWIFSCTGCNDFKGNKWPQECVYPCNPNENDERPELEYVNPCASDPNEYPDQYFRFYEGGIEAKQGISDSAKRKACKTICDFGLSDWTLVRPRFRSVVRFIKDFFARLNNLSLSEQDDFIADFLSRTTNGRVEVLIKDFADTDGILEYPGVKAMVVEEILRNGRQGLERLGLPEILADVYGGDKATV